MSLSHDTILQAHRFRHACKTYDPTRTVRDEDFRLILETGRLSPSSFGFEPWRFLVIERPELRQLIHQHAWGAAGKVLDCSRFLLIITRRGSTLHADDPYIGRMMHDIHQIPEDAARLRRDYYRAFTENDFALTADARAFDDWARRQSYIALANMLTTAALLGIDSTPIEGFPQQKMDELFEEAGLYHSNEYTLSVMAAFGYRLNEPREKTRRPFDEVVTLIR